MDNSTIFSKIKDDMQVIIDKDPAIDSRIELIFNYPGLWALVFYRFANWFYRKDLRVIARMIMAFAGMLCNIDIHPAATIGRRIFIDHGIGVVIGSTAIIEDNVTIYQGVTLGGTSLERKKRHPTVKEGAVIGAGAKVLGDIEIGRNAKIGGNSVVVKPVPDDATAVGIPARVITKGRARDPMDHTKLPDIDRQVFEYLLKRVAILEHAIKTGDCNIDAKDAELDEIYKAFLKAMKS